MRWSLLATRGLPQKKKVAKNGDLLPCLWPHRIKALPDRFGGHGGHLSDVDQRGLPLGVPAGTTKYLLCSRPSLRDAQKKAGEAAGVW
jgi:hypothetical protein